MPGVACESGMDSSRAALTGCLVLLGSSSAIGRRNGQIGSLQALPRHCEERSDEAIHPSAMPRDGLLRFARNDAEGAEELASAILIRRNLNQTPVGIPAIDRTQRAAG